MDLRAIVNQPSKKLKNAYEASFEELFKDMERRGDEIEHHPTKKQQKILQMRNMCSFKGIEPCEFDSEEEGVIAADTL